MFSGTPNLKRTSGSGSSSCPGLWGRGKKEKKKKVRSAKEGGGVIMKGKIPEYKIQSKAE